MKRILLGFALVFVLANIFWAGYQDNHSPLIKQGRRRIMARIVIILVGFPVAAMILVPPVMPPGPYPELLPRLIAHVQKSEVPLRMLGSGHDVAPIFADVDRIYADLKANWKPGAPEPRYSEAIRRSEAFPFGTTDFFQSQLLILRDGKPPPPFWEKDFVTFQEELAIYVEELENSTFKKLRRERDKRQAYRVLFYAVMVLATVPSLMLCWAARTQLFHRLFPDPPPNARAER